MRCTALSLTALLVALAGCGGGDSPAAPADTRAADAGPAPTAADIPRADAGRAVVWAVGDAATPGTDADRIGVLVRGAKPDLFLYLGDVYESGTRAEFRKWYQPRFGRLAGITMPTIGNHEYANRFSGFYPYWASHKGHRQPPWSKRTVAGWQILDLNSQAPHGPGSPQVRWLERTLANAQGDCRIAFWHRPRFTHGAYEDAPDLNPLWNRLAGHARIVLSGHDHNLQRHRPVKGLIQYVVGAGGRGRYQLHGGDPTMVWSRDDVNAALRMVLKPGSALLEFRSPRHRVLDRSRVSCAQ
jgi:Calcineurin-like phosphoesterase